MISHHRSVFALDTSDALLDERLKAVLAQSADLAAVLITVREVTARFGDEQSQVEIFSTFDSRRVGIAPSQHRACVEAHLASILEDIAATRVLDPRTARSVEAIGSRQGVKT